MIAAKHMTSVLFLVQFEISTRLWASFGVTHSYSSCLFLCALALVYLLFPSLIPSSHHTRYSHVGSEVSGKPTQGHQFSSTKCNNYSIILGHMHSVYIAQMLWQMRLLRFILHVGLLYVEKFGLQEYITHVSLCFAEEQPLRYNGLVTQKDQFSEI